MKKDAKKKAQAQRLKEVEHLFELATEIFSTDAELAHRYVKIARKISMKINLRLSSELQRKFCKHCKKFMMPGANCRVRINDSKIIYYCLECKKFSRIPLK